MNDFQSLSGVTQVRRCFFALFFLAINLCFIGIDCLAENKYTPPPGSAERKAICEGARSFVMSDYVRGIKLPQPLLFKIQRIEIVGNYCSFQATPVFKDGSPIGTDYIEDIIFDFCLKRHANNWVVVYDLSSTDVPNDSSLRGMWKIFPKDFPLHLLDRFWRERFDKLKRIN